MTDANKNIVEKVKIICDINGTDIQLIRNITICDGGGNPTEDTGALIYLDLSEANIVAGGSSYTAYTNDEVVNTENNIVTNGMFEYTNLETIILPNNITKIGARAFQVLKNMERLVIPEGVTIIEREAFDTNYNLKEIILPESVEEIGEYAFCSCNKLQSIKLPNKLTTVGEYLFMSCSALKTITLPNNLEKIKNSAFSYCTSLETITIPNNVSYIDYNVFVGCSALNTIHCKATTPPTIVESTFNNLYTTCTLYVPTANKSSYTTADYWKNFTKIEGE